MVIASSPAMAISPIWMPLFRPPVRARADRAAPAVRCFLVMPLPRGHHRLESALAASKFAPNEWWQRWVDWPAIRGRSDGRGRVHWPPAPRSPAFLKAGDPVRASTKRLFAPGPAQGFGTLHACDPPTHLQALSILPDRPEIMAGAVQAGPSLDDEFDHVLPCLPGTVPGLVFWGLRPPMQNLRGRYAFQLASVSDCVSIRNLDKECRVGESAMKRAINERSEAGLNQPRGGT